MPVVYFLFQILTLFDSASIVVVDPTKSRGYARFFLQAQAARPLLWPTPGLLELGPAALGSFLFFRFPFLLFGARSCCAESVGIGRVTSHLTSRWLPF